MDFTTPSLARTGTLGYSAGTEEVTEVGLVVAIAAGEHVEQTAQVGHRLFPGLLLTAEDPAEQVSDPSAGSAPPPSRPPRRSPGPPPPPSTVVAPLPPLAPALLRRRPASHDITSGASIGSNLEKRPASAFPPAPRRCSTAVRSEPNKCPTIFSPSAASTNASGLSRVRMSGS